MGAQELWQAGKVNVEKGAAEARLKRGGQGTEDASGAQKIALLMHPCRQRTVTARFVGADMMGVKREVGGGATNPRLGGVLITTEYMQIMRKVGCSNLLGVSRLFSRYNIGRQKFHLLYYVPST